QWADLLRWGVPPVCSAMGDLLDPCDQQGPGPLEGDRARVLGGIAGQRLTVGDVRDRLSQYFRSIAGPEDTPYGRVLVEVRQQEPVHLLQPGPWPNLDSLCRQPLHDPSRAGSEGVLVRPRQALGDDAVWR